MSVRGVPAESALNLAVFRVVVPAVVLISPELYTAAQWAALPPGLRVAPEGMGHAVSLLPIAPAVARSAQWLLACACVAALLGYHARVAMASVTVLGLYVFGHAQLGGTVLHDMHLFWFSALLAASPCGDALSIDRLRGRTRGAPAPSIEYGLPLQAARALLGVIYFFPGFHKLWTSGSAWVWSDNLLNQMHWKWYQMGGFTPALRVDRWPQLLQVGALLVVLFELFFIVLALVPRLRLLALAGGIAFHASADYFLRIPFSSLWLCYVVLIDWGAVARRWRDARDAMQPAPPARRPARAVQPAAVVFAVLFVANTVQGARGMMQAWPFACYPTFEWIAGPLIPDLRVEAVGADGAEVPLPDGPSTGGTRSQQRWGMAWRVAGLYGGAPDPARLSDYAALLARDQRVRSVADGAVMLRFYLAHHSVRPEHFGAPPRHKRLLGEIAWPTAADAMR
jgi:hypothetical protein